jgi:hypothetical protein
MPGADRGARGRRGDGRAALVVDSPMDVGHAQDHGARTAIVDADFAVFIADGTGQAAADEGDPVFGSRPGNTMLSLDAAGRAQVGRSGAYRLRCERRTARETPLPGADSFGVEDQRTIWDLAGKRGQDGVGG